MWKTQAGSRSLFCMTRSRFYFVAAAFSAAGWLALSPPEQGQADPRDKLMPRKDGQSACFRRDYDAAHLKVHPGQATQAILISLKYEDGNVEGVMVRAMMKRKGGATPYFMMGGCDWAEHKKPGPEAARILGAARHSRGLVCLMLEAGHSARESGQIVFDFSADARTGVAVFDPVIAAWRGMDQSKSAPDLTLGREDLVFRLTRADGQACREMEHGIKF